MTPVVQRALLIFFVTTLVLWGGAAIIREFDPIPWWSRPDELVFECAKGAIAGGAAVISSILWARRALYPAGPICLLLVAIVFPLSLLLGWDMSSSESDRLFKWAATLWILCGSTMLIALLTLARFRRRYLWLRIATSLSVLALAAAVWRFLVFQPIDPQLDGMLKTSYVAVVLIVVGSGIHLALHRMTRLRAAEYLLTSDSKLSLTCPRCHTAVTLPLGGAQCPECRLRILIEVEEERCRKCGYSLFKLESDVCPECGTPPAG